MAFLVGNLSLTVERMLTTYLGVGNVSVLDYGRKFIDMPISVIIGVIATIFTPTVARMHAQADHNACYDECIKFLRMIILGLTPFIVLCSACAKELVEILLLRGSFKVEFVGITANVLTCFSFGVIGYVMFAVGGQVVVAKGNPARYSLISTLAIMTSLTMNLLCFNRFGLLVFPVSWGTTMLLAGVYLLLYGNDRRLATLSQLLKITSVTVMAVAAGYLVKYAASGYGMPAVLNPLLHNIVTVAYVAIFGNVAYYVILCCCRINEVREINSIVRNMIHKRSSV
jgi:peptidoglycan biosynthesis protein MviN/MurJ (putative lipid II flippase)